jgi:micrococcal nuclease
MKRLTRPSNVVRFSGQRRANKFSLKDVSLLFGSAIAFGTFAGVALHYWPSGEARLSFASSSASSVHFSICSAGGGANCVIDGDTIHWNGEKVRLVGFNTPEISEPQCAAEATKGKQATLRLQQLLNSGSLSFSATADRDRDRYGRLLREVRVDGRDVAEVLISEGLAEPYSGGQKRDWC